MRKQAEVDTAIKEWDVCMLVINNFPQFFVRVNYIWADERRDWWNVSFTQLTIPSNTWTWKLDTSHLNGMNFEMGGTPMQLQVLVRPNLEKQEIQETPIKPVLNNPQPTLEPRQKVVSLFPASKECWIDGPPQKDPPSVA
jgi:hypothetical protein